jgi:hypothetical protein
MLPFPQRWVDALVSPFTNTERFFESLVMRYYRAALAAQTHRERLEWLGTCDTFDFARHAARDTRGRI